MEERIEKLREIVKIQCSDGNWNYCSYMHGMANGLILALALIEDTEPKYLEAPDEWLGDNQAKVEDLLLECSSKLGW